MQCMFMHSSSCCTQACMQLQRDWDAIQAATRATSIAPCSAEAALALSNAQLNYGEVSCVK